MPKNVVVRTTGTDGEQKTLLNGELDYTHNGYCLKPKGMTAEEAALLLQEQGRFVVKPDYQPALTMRCRGLQDSQIELEQT